MLARIAVGGILLIFAAETTAGANSSVDSLFQAIRKANKEEMARVLDGGTSANARDSDGTPALMAAALFGDANSLKLLLDRGANPNATNSAGATALLWAVPDLGKVKILIARGANVNAASSNLKRTALLVAASYPNSVDVMRLLLGKGANIRARDQSGMHALGRAVGFADFESVRFLVENGADIHEPGYGEYGAELAFGRHDVRLSEYLLALGFKVPKEALAFAGTWHQPKLLERLIAAGADVNARIDVLKSTPLVMATAAEQTSLDTLTWLLEKGANPNQRRRWCPVVALYSRKGARIRYAGAYKGARHHGDRMGRNLGGSGSAHQNVLGEHRGKAGHSGGGWHAEGTVWPHRARGKTGQGQRSLCRTLPERT
jgi:ankyrin repeat protein